MEAPARNNAQLLTTLLTALTAALLGLGTFLGSPSVLAVPINRVPVPKGARAEKPANGRQLAVSGRLPATSRLRVLVLGDSHTASTFGRALDLLLRSRPQTDVTTVGSCGVSPGAFLHGTPRSHCGYLQIEKEHLDWQIRQDDPPSLAQLLADSQPDLTVIELGANQIRSAWKRPQEAARDIRELAERVTTFGSKCVWVGPPYGARRQKPFEKLDHDYDLLSMELQGRCELIDSRPDHMPFLDYEKVAAQAGRHGDGRHFDAIGVVGQQAARHWALSVFQVAQQRLDALEAHNTLSKMPSGTHTEDGLVVAAVAR